MSFTNATFLKAFLLHASMSLTLILGPSISDYTIYSEPLLASQGSYTVAHPAFRQGTLHHALQHEFSMTSQHFSDDTVYAQWLMFEANANHKLCYSKQSCFLGTSLASLQGGCGATTA